MWGVEKDDPELREVNGCRLIFIRSIYWWQQTLSHIHHLHFRLYQSRQLSFQDQWSPKQLNRVQPCLLWLLNSLLTSDNNYASTSCDDVPLIRWQLWTADQQSVAVHSIHLSEITLKFTYVFFKCLFKERLLFLSWWHIFGWLQPFN